MMIQSGEITTIREYILERDNKKCQLCYKHTLTTHYLKGYSADENIFNNTNNWLTLCDECRWYVARKKYFTVSEVLYDRYNSL
jgi:hypothetical protein